MFVTLQQHSKANMHRKVDTSGGMVSLLLERIYGTLKGVCHIWEILQNLLPLLFSITGMFIV